MSHNHWAHEEDNRVIAEGPHDQTGKQVLLYPLVVISLLFLKNLYFELTLISIDL